MARNKGFLMVLSVLLAIVFWVYVGDENPDISGTVRNLPVTFVGLETLESRGLMITGGMDQSITLNVTGKRELIHRLSAETVSITVDVSSVQQPGEYTQAYRIAYNLSGTSTPLVTDQYPLNVSFTVARQATRSIPVHGNATGSSVAEGYQFGGFSFLPETIEVRGEESLVNQIESAVVTLSREDMTETFEGDLPYTFMSFLGEPIESDALETSATLVRTILPVLRLKEVELTVNLIPGGGITADNMNDYVQCEITPKSIMVSGEADDLETLQKISLGDIDLAKLLRGDTFSYPISLATGLTNVSGVAEATVDISIEGLTTVTLETADIQCINIPEGYRARPVTTTCQIQIRGPEEAVNAVTSSQIRVVADLNNAVAATGTQTIRAKVYVDGSSDVGAVGEYNVVVSVSK